MDVDAGHLAKAERLPVARPNPLHIHTRQRKFHRLRNPVERPDQFRIRTAGPDLGRGHSQRVNVHDGPEIGQLILGQCAHEEVRPPQSHLFGRKPDKQDRVFPRTAGKTLIEARQQRCSAPVVDDAGATLLVIIMRADDNFEIGQPRKRAEYVAEPFIFTACSVKLGTTQPAASNSRRRLHAALEGLRGISLNTLFHNGFGNRNKNE